ncbi:MAG: MFS transporter [Bacillota bacterium]
MSVSVTERPALGLRANWQQFWLLVLVNGFVGAMVGLERTVLPLIAEQEFGLASRSAVLSFIVTFGLVKAVTNFFAGRLSDAIGRKRILMLGWLLGLPVPLLVIWAPSWGWIVFANVLLGLNQGLAWSTTVIMKIDLVGPRQRGLAMGLNEFAGYLAVALSTLASGYLASQFGLRPEPFYLGIAYGAAGLALSGLFVRETLGHARAEAGGGPASGGTASPGLSAGEVFARTTWRDPALSSASQAGLVNNLNDGLAWGLFPLFFAGAGLPIEAVGVIAAVYPGAWGLFQLWTGALSDRWGRRWMIAAGMWVQAAALGAMLLFEGFAAWVGVSVALGLGTAMVYPTLLAAIGDVAHPSWRASAVGVYRLWRDSGYAVGAILAGIMADLFGIPAAILLVAVLTLLSGVVVAVRMPETLKAGR